MCKIKMINSGTIFDESCKEELFIKRRKIRCELTKNFIVRIRYWIASVKMSDDANRVDKLVSTNQ